MPKFLLLYYGCYHIITNETTASYHKYTVQLSVDANAKASYMWDE